MHLSSESSIKQSHVINSIGLLLSDCDIAHLFIYVPINTNQKSYIQILNNNVNPKKILYT